MSSFLNKSPRDSKVLHEPIYKNGLKLKKDAVILVEHNESYSTANSLLILSSEEAIKAILVLLHSEGYHVYKIPDAKKFFTDHKIRHEVAKLIEFINGLFKSLNKYDEQEPAKLFTKSFLNDIVNVVIASKPLFQSIRRIKLLTNFNDDKNKGFYVDLRQELLLPYDQFNSEKYKKTLDVVDQIFRAYKLLKLIHNQQLTKRSNKEEVENMKDQLRMVINEGMSDFSFKEVL